MIGETEMFMSFFKPDDIKILRKNSDSYDDFGNPIVTESIIDAKAMIKYGSNNVNVSSDNLRISSYDAELFFQTGTIIKNNDEFIIKNQKFKIDSTPEAHSNIFSNNFISPMVVVKVVRGEYIGQ